MVNSMFLIALPFELVYLQRNGIIQPIFLNLLFRQMIPILPTQILSECCWQWINPVTTMKPVTSRLGRKDTYISPPGIASAILLRNQENMRRTHLPFLEKFCESMSTGHQIPDKII